MRAEPPSIDWCTPVALEQLTVAEQHVVRLIADGMSSARIAERRGTSVRTVDSQLATLYRRFSVVSRRELLLRLYGSSLPEVSRAHALRLLQHLASP